MTETVDSDKTEGESVCVCKGGGIFYSPSPIFLFPYLIPLSFHWERRGASDGSGKGEGTEKS